MNTLASRSLFEQLTRYQPITVDGGGALRLRSYRSSCGPGEAGRPGAACCHAIDRGSPSTVPRGARREPLRSR